MGATGAGHFAKMVHNGIEYGMMQAIAEGAAVLEESQFKPDLAEVFRVYNNKSVIESRLVNWAREAFVENPRLENISSTISHLLYSQSDTENPCLTPCYQVSRSSNPVQL